ncbi:hypothetical protein Godav_025847 [Gossypium davidsonii]|uniref:Uncharacterized protein n=1 Tax=Gossypium davidsonii TaxID=34287 RepID=A0A7J8TKF5_GOSDV|nr:hypothetical protein [Gossypium davidsonii]MBA0638706.1 hypothetical protein [Gossypium davidsonii]
MHNTMNGDRIKTWQGGRGSVQGVVFSNIQVFEAVRPIGYNIIGHCTNPVPNERTRTDDTFYWQAFVEFTAPTVPPIRCLKTDKPLNNRAQSNRDV